MQLIPSVNLNKYPGGQAVSTSFVRQDHPCQRTYCSHAPACTWPDGLSGDKEPGTHFDEEKPVSDNYSGPSPMKVDRLPTGNYKEEIIPTASSGARRIEKARTTKSGRSGEWLTRREASVVVPEDVWRIHP